MRLALLSLVIAFAMPVVSAAQNATDVAEGKKLFGGLCVTCHGFDGAGGAGPPLNRPRLLSAPDDASLRNIIAEGIPNRGMPRVRRVTDDEMRQLVSYVRSIGKIARPAVRGDAARGGQLYAKLGCAGCHIVNGAGGSLGPELTSGSPRNKIPFNAQATACGVVRSLVGVEVAGGRVVVRLASDQCRGPRLVL